MTYFQTYFRFQSHYRHVESQPFAVKVRDLEALARARLELERVECERRSGDHD